MAKTKTEPSHAWIYKGTKDPTSRKGTKLKPVKDPVFVGRFIEGVRT